MAATKRGIELLMMRPNRVPKYRGIPILMGFFWPTAAEWKHNIFQHDTVKYTAAAWIYYLQENVRRLGNESV